MKTYLEIVRKVANRTIADEMNGGMGRIVGAELIGEIYEKSYVMVYSDIKDEIKEIKMKMNRDMLKKGLK